MIIRRGLFGLIASAVLLLSGMAQALTFTALNCTGANTTVSCSGNNTSTINFTNSSTATPFTDTITFSTDASSGLLAVFEFDVPSFFDSTVSLKLNNVAVAPGLLNLLVGANTLEITTSSTGSFGGYAGKLTAVPLPAAAWLFISALGGLAVIGRRRRMIKPAA